MGIQAVADRYGWQREELLVFGDGDNDAGCCPGRPTACPWQRHPRRQAAAGYVTTPVGEDGVQNALLHLGVLTEEELRAEQA